jgi:hypothetical protein
MILIFPTFKPGNYGQAFTSVSSAVKLKTPGWIGKKGPREYAHIHMGVHEDIGFQERGSGDE